MKVQHSRKTLKQWEMDLYLDMTIGQLTKIRTPCRRKNSVDELWKLPIVNKALQLELAQKSELSLND